MTQARFIPYVLNFREPGGTSRGVMTTRKVWFIILTDSNNPGRTGIGECAPLAGLSCDDMNNYENMLNEVCLNIDKYLSDLSLLRDYPSICFGVEMAWLDFRHDGKRRLFPSDFTDGRKGIKINGLIWMGSESEMTERIKDKLRNNFTCLKLKIGAIDFERELQILRSIRDKFDESELEIRVDANGAFSYNDALEKINRLSEFHIHSIEQPIKAGEWSDMADICSRSPIPVALDEELIGIKDDAQRAKMLDIIKPRYIIIKPSLTGGFASSDVWVRLAKERNIDWWSTSALESNIGLNAIAQWSSTKELNMPQGLGTGKVFTNNLPSSLQLRGDLLFRDSENQNADSVSYFDFV